MSQLEQRRSQAASQPWAHLRLPPFPQVAVRVMQLVGNENVQLRQLSDLISSDPAFAGEVLTIANSVLYSPRNPCTSILQAIALLGANNLQGLCLTVGVRAYMGRAFKQPFMRSLWLHNLASAIIAEQIASAGFLDKDIAFTCGIMHDVGRLALAVVRPAEYSELLTSFSGPPEGILAGESELFGLDHCQAGSQLVGAWNLPGDFQSTVAEHHLPRLDDGAWSMTELVKLSCGLADVAGYPALANCQKHPFESLLEKIPPRERMTFPTDIGALLHTVEKKIKAIESV